MVIILKQLLIIFTFLFSCSACAPTHIQKQRTFMQIYNRELEKEDISYEAGIELWSYDKIERFNYIYSSKFQLNVEEARILLVDKVEDLLNRINNDYKLRPYLCEYPFPANKISLMFLFVDEKKNPIEDPHVSCVALYNNSSPLIRGENPEEIVQFEYYDDETNRYEGFRQETYEDSKRIYKKYKSNLSTP